MLHNINELYRAQGSNKLLTKEAGEIVQKHRPVYKVHHYIHHKDAVNVYDVDGVKTIYMFGEKTWFDTQEELDAHRAAYQKEQEKLKERNKIKKSIIAKLDNMTTEQLQAILESLGVE